ncbi:hypothetical protein SEPCBS57363_001362 [Sporothrix epigloea]|uniref:WW domain-containing protein n=1 Tax=Sporothrix epigloea TaxID=1892477 RepID=A0ABP0DDN7_9PEZI
MASPTATIRYVHFSGPRPDDDDESDIIFDYNYYGQYIDYSHGRNARPRDYIREELPLRSDSFGQRRSRSADNDARDKNQRAKRSDQKPPRAAVENVAAGAATGAAVGGYMAARHRERDKAPRDAPKARSMPASSAGQAYKTPPDRPPLPKGWTPVYSTAHGRWYYVNKRLGRTQWEAPGFEHSKEREIMSDKGRRRQAPVQNRRRRQNSHSPGPSITGVLLGAASGIAAGTLAAKALGKKRLSDRSGRSDRRQDKETRDDRSDFEEDNVPGYRHSHSESNHNSDPGHGSDDEDDIDDSDD